MCNDTYVAINGFSQVVCNRCSLERHYLIYLQKIGRVCDECVQSKTPQLCIYSLVVVQGMKLLVFLLQCSLVTRQVKLNQAMKW